MFRDLKEYQEIAKIYTDKVSKPENLEENRNQMAMKLRQEREANKPAPEPKVKPTYQTNRDKMIQSRSANRPKSREEVGLRPKQSQGRISRSSQNMAGKPKPIPSTAEIRAKNPKVVPGTRTNEIGAQGGGKPSEGNFKKDFPDKKPEVKTQIPVKKMGRIEKQNRAKFGDEKIDALKKKNTEFQAAKKSGNLAQFRKDNPKISGADRAKQMAKERLAKKAAMEEYTPYDIVLEYLLSSEQAATIEEANYVMTEMDAETIQSIVSN